MCIYIYIKLGCEKKIHKMLLQNKLLPLKQAIENKKYVFS